MNQRSLCEYDGNAAIEVDSPHPFADCERIISFSDICRDAACDGEPRSADTLRAGHSPLESVSLGNVSPDVEYIEARHLFYWMTDERPVELRARHASGLSRPQREACYVAGRLKNAVINHPYVAGSGSEAARPATTVSLSKWQGALFLAADLAAACAVALIGC